MLVRLSVRKVPNLSKSDREDYTHFTNYIERKFSDLVYLLRKDYIYSPFAFLGHHRLTTNICSEANFIVIDVDHTSITIDTRLQQLSDEGLNCIIGTTSSKQDLTKYRVLLPLETSVTADEYRRLVKGIQSNGLIPDMDMASAKPAQPFYAYADSYVIANFTGSNLVVADYIQAIPDSGEHSIDTSVDLEELLDKVKFYPYAIKGSRTKALLSTGFQLLELGASDEQLEQALIQFNNKLLVPKDRHSLYRRVINFLISRR